MDPYTLLSLSPHTITPSKIHIAYHRLSILHHPDNAGPDSAAYFAVLTEAYESLIDGTYVPPVAAETGDADEKGEGNRRKLGRKGSAEWLKEKVRRLSLSLSR